MNPNRIITASVNRLAGPFPKGANWCVGSGRTNEGLRADFLEHLATAVHECGFRYLRCHGLLHDDMGVVQQAKDGSLVFNFQYIDAFYDRILALGVRPIVEFSFMPKALACGDTTFFWWKANVTPPKDPEIWAELIRRLVRHWLQRYGQAEVRHWFFEVWNEPNLTCFWTGGLEGYLALYETTVRAIKDVDSSLRVGGPAAAGEGFVADLLARCAERQLPIDFVTAHAYAVDGAVDEFGTSGLTMSRNPDVITDCFISIRAAIHASAFPDMPLHITEWNSSYSPRDQVHDHYFNAAFTLHKAKELLRVVDTLSYWTVSDVFEEAGIPTLPFHGGFGLINLQGLKKPAYFAHRFLASMGATELAQDDSDAWVTTDGVGIQALVWDYTLWPQDTINQTFFVRDLVPAAKPDAHLTIEGLSPGTYELALTRVGHRCNDVFADWYDLGKPAHLRPATVADMAARHAGAPTELTRVTVGEDGKFLRILPLHENTVWFVTLTPATA